jgi:ABC-type polar amino acid transport system ATPase subunit
MQLPTGYAADAQQFSGGQQRVAIARLFLIYQKLYDQGGAYRRISDA